MGHGKRRRIEPTDDWKFLVPLFEWPEQQDYEELRPVTLFGASVVERAREIGTSERTLYRRIERFERDGMLSLFATDPAAARAKRRGLETAIRRMIVELKAEHPKLNANEIANIVYVRTGRRLGKHTPGRVLSEEVVSLKLSRLFEPYHESPDRREAREAVVTLHLDGWSVKAIASYLLVSRTTVYGSWAVDRGGRGGPGGPAARKAQGRAQDGPRHDELHPPLAGEPRARRVPHPRGLGAEKRRRGQRAHRRQGDGCPLRALRPRKAQEEPR